MSVNELGVSLSFFPIQIALHSEEYEKEIRGLEETDCRPGYSHP